MATCHSFSATGRFEGPSSSRCFCLKTIDTRYKCILQVIQASEIEAKHDREEVETRLNDGPFVDLP
jgi:hypothetical protein